MPYRFAIIGCGNISDRHAAAITRLGTLAGVCDPDLPRALILADRYGTPAYSSLDKMLQEEKPDIVAVCSPSGMHPSHVYQSFDSGCHVVCEKPLAIDSLAASNMLEKAASSGKKLFVVKQNRFNAPVATLRRLLEAGRLGRVHGFQINCFWNRNQDYYNSAPWRGSASMSGGTLFTQFSHFFDLLYWLLGPIGHVSGWRANFCHTTLIDFEDTGSASIVMESGAIGSLHYTINAHHQNLEGSFTLFGDKGTVKIGGPYLNQFDYFNVEGVILNDWLTQPGSNATGHEAVYQAVLKTLDGADFSGPDSKETLGSIKMIEQIYNASPMIL